MSDKPKPARQARASAIRAQQTFVTNGASYHPSSDDDAEDNRPATRTSRRGTRLELGKLDAASLHRYRRLNKLGEAPPTASKDELLPGVLRHFNAQIVEEEEVLLKFVQAIKRHNQQLMMNPLQFAKKPPGIPQGMSRPGNMNLKR